MKTTVPLWDNFTTVFQFRSMNTDEKATKIVISNTNLGLFWNLSVIKYSRNR